MNRCLSRDIRKTQEEGSLVQIVEASYPYLNVNDVLD